MSSTVEFNQEYFDKLMEESAKEEAAKHGEAINTVCQFMNKDTLVSLFKLDGKEFYKTLLLKLGSLRYIEKANKNVQKAIEEVMLATGLSEEGAKSYLVEEESKTKANLNGMATIKLIAGNILGFLKFSLDALLLTTAFAGRVSCKLVANLGKAFYDTGKFAVSDGREVGKALRSSWSFNMKGII